MRRVVEKRIKPKLGRVKITDLTRSDIKAWHQAMSATLTKRTAPSLTSRKC
jgi:Phage integrase, N-terminal SAM-like domain